jgi:hypothetical protein
MELLELDGNQRRQLINIQQMYSAWQRTRLERRRMGGMHWKSAPSGQQYLYSTTKNTQKSVGPRSSVTEETYQSHQGRIAELDSRLENLSGQLNRFAPVNKAYNLAHVPLATARILRRLKDTPRIDNRLIVVGTNALFAYEAATGLQFPSSLTATEDLDLLWNARRQLSLILPDANVSGFFALLKSVDHSYERIMSFRAENRDGFIVDIIRPQVAHETLVASPRLSADTVDLDPSPIDGLQWLVNAPRLAETAIAEDGLPVHIATVDPRAYALHKLWLSKRAHRNPIKRTRDREQAHTVADVAVKWLNLSFADTALSALPVELMAGAEELGASMAEVLQP